MHALCNHNNNSINKNIDIILKHLFDIYGKTTPQMIIQREDVDNHMTFDVNTSINTVFDNILLPQLSMVFLINSISNWLTKFLTTWVNTI